MLDGVLLCCGTQSSCKFKGESTVQLTSLVIQLTTFQKIIYPVLMEKKKADDYTISHLSSHFRENSGTQLTGLI